MEPPTLVRGLTVQARQRFPGASVFRMSVCLMGAAAAAGCVHGQPANPYSANGYCFMQSGWQDSSAICSPLDSYAYCYLQCPRSGSGGSQAPAPRRWRDGQRRFRHRQKVKVTPAVAKFAL